MLDVAEYDLLCREGIGRAEANDAAVPTEELGECIKEGNPVLSVEARLRRGRESVFEPSCQVPSCIRASDWKASLLLRTERLSLSSVGDSGLDIDKSENVRDRGLSTVGDRWGMMSTFGASDVAGMAGVKVGETFCTSVVCETSFLRHLSSSQPGSAW